MLGSFKKKAGQSIVMAVVLLYCGLLSASKSFVITAVLVVFFGILHLLRARRNISHKIVTIVTMSVVIIVVWVSNIFSVAFNIVAIRFENSTNIADLTTGRSTIWMNYFEYIKSNIGVMLFGKGYTNVLVEGRASHNTLIQGVYQFGIVGLSIFLVWLRCLFDITLQHLKIKRKQYAPCIILAVGVFLPWLGIDLLFFDEFFLMMLYVSSGFKWICEYFPEETLADKSKKELE